MQSISFYSSSKDIIMIMEMLMSGGRWFFINRPIEGLKNGSTGVGMQSFNTINFVIHDKH